MELLLTAKAIAMLDSVTVSIGLLINGVRIVIFFVSGEVKSYQGERGEGEVGRKRRGGGGRRGGGRERGKGGRKEGRGGREEREERGRGRRGREGGKGGRKGGKGEGGEGGRRKGGRQKGEEKWVERSLIELNLIKNMLIATKFTLVVLRSHFKSPIPNSNSHSSETIPRLKLPQD